MGGAASATAPLHAHRTRVSSRPALLAAAASHPGLIRPHNEDAHLVQIPNDPALRETRGALFAVADGVGGQAAGEVASRTAVDALAQEYFSPRAPHQIEAALRQAMAASNLAVHTLAHGSDPALRTMQTTLASLVVARQQAYVAHAGDTRIYLSRDGALTQLTGDHSEAAEMLRLRLITAEQAAVHPRRTVLTRALGATPTTRPDFQRVPLRAGDRFLICTDGLWGDVPEDLLATTLADHPSGMPDQLAERLLALALDRGGGDNITLVVIDVLETGPVTSISPAAGGRIGRLLAGLRGGG